MKFKLLHFQIATAALLAPVAVSLASTTPKATQVAKPTTTIAQVAPTPGPALQPVAIIQTTPAAAPSCGSKVRVVYSGYVQPAPKAC